jgi:hypothetical protein
MSEEKECKKCKQKNTSVKQILMGLAGFYLLFSAIYGTIQIVHDLVNLFK